MKVVIAGGGIGGLAAAVSTRRAGCEVTVLEQASELTPAGAGMSLWPNALDALDVLGLGDQARTVGINAATRGSFRTPSGSWLRRARPDDISALVLLRSDLHQMLVNACGDVDVRLGAQVESVVPAVDGVVVGYRGRGGRKEIEADVLVGADGIHSAVRQAVWPDGGPRFQRRTAWRGITQESFDEQIGPGTLTLGRGQQFGALPLPQGCYWFLTADADLPGRRYPDELGEVRRRAGQWHCPILDILDATPPESVLHHDIVDWTHYPALSAATSHSLATQPTR